MASKRFIAIYQVPASVLADWAKQEPTSKKAEEEKMMAAWNKWMGDHAKMIVDTQSGGKTKRITSSGISDFKNDIMLYSIIEAETHEEAAKAFADHPHLQIPQASIEIMEIRPMTA